ncbi:probable auxin efflux carrier component 5b [Aegilops tauschii subsp. strangulata]|uniref:probable auxin efflux carrier component 5b n=1 Tax=Aegilops tauschii subsp. strangulata TaxID=200361 RepID=UPI00098AA6C5|nr:probable auxin efflux carrier component 5b [Aegilops tauschii subsp. strangulata]
MIGWGDVYKVVSAMAPLYFALGLGYASVRWWKFFTRDQCDAVNRLVIYFALPFFAFDFNAHAGTFAAGYRVLAADAVAKLVVVLALGGWVAYCRWRHWIRGPKAPPASSAWPGPSWSWCITGYSLGTLNNGLFVGVPLLDAMYGKWARDIVLQLSVLQAVVWLPLLLVVFEARQAWLEVTSAPAPDGGAREEGDQAALGSDDGDGRKTAATGCAFWARLLRTVGLKVGGNPNVYASLLGVLWSSVANRWHLEMPGIVDGSISIMSRTGLGIGMFNTGLFIGLQDKLVVCRPGLTMLGMAMRFVAAPAATAVGALLLGLRGDLLRVAILQAALPQSVGAFIFALEYDLHADVLSTVVIVGTLASLPVIITYYIVLGLL